MANRRFLHLIALVLAGALVLAARLFQVQILQHEVWADEAAKLVRSGTIVPFERGRILDRAGRTLVRDHELYRIDFVYRDFRRGHPLGLATHARSTLELRAVPLAEGARELAAWAGELVLLSPRALAAWAEGAELRTPSFVSPESSEPEASHRRSRARDLGFYAARLLELSRAEGRAMHEVLTEWEEEASFLELVAGWRAQEPVELQSALAARWSESLVDLAGLARLLAAPQGAARGGAAFDELLADLEACRARVEDGTASLLFRGAAGFLPGRVAAELLHESIDLDWITLRLRWDRERTRSWLAGAREQWLAWRESFAVEALAAELALAKDPAGAPDLVLDEMAALYALGADAGAPEEQVQRTARRPWAQVDELVALDQLEAALDVPPAAGEREPRWPWSRRAARAPEPVLPTQQAELRAWPAGPGREELLARAERFVRGAGPPAAPLVERELVRGAAATWSSLLQVRAVGSAAFRERVVLLQRAFESAFQAALEERLAELLLRAGADGGRLAGGRLAFREERLERATERSVYIALDLGSREQRIARDPTYEVVHLLARYPDRFAGFEARDTHVRVSEVFDAAGNPLADELLGHVRQSDVLELREQREEAEELARLLALGTRTPAEDERVAALVPRVVRPEEVHGAEGLEALLEPELRGYNGYTERRGLSDRLGGAFAGRDWAVLPIDGQDAFLTLDVELQRAAQSCLESPAPDPDTQAPADAVRDDDWLVHPVGAIVLLTAEGDVLAAASVPADAPAGGACRSAGRGSARREPRAVGPSRSSAR